ncbi:MAG: hypothetical protein ACR2P1_07425 [Pseudomonadales bacterium]
MKNEITVSAKKIVELFDFLEQAGIDVNEIAASQNLPPGRIRRLHPHQQLPALVSAKLYQSAMKKMQQMNRAVPWGAGVGSDAFEFMCRSILTARTLGEALEIAR